MPNPAILPSEQVAVLGVLDPDSYANGAAGTHLLSNVDLSDFESAMVILSVGDMVSTSTVDLTVESATTSGGSYGAIGSGKAITQMVQGTDDNKQAIVNIRANELTAGHRFLEVDLVVGTAASECSVVVIGVCPKYGPASDGNVSTVDSIDGA